MLNSMTTGPIAEKEVSEVGVIPDNQVLIEVVVVIKSSPGTLQLVKETEEHLN